MKKVLGYLYLAAAVVFAVSLLAVILHWPLSAVALYVARVSGLLLFVACCAEFFLANKESKLGIGSAVYASLTAFLFCISEVLKILIFPGGSVLTIVSVLMAIGAFLWFAIQNQQKNILLMVCTLVIPVALRPSLSPIVLFPVESAMQTADENAEGLASLSSDLYNQIEDGEWKDIAATLKDSCEGFICYAERLRTDMNKDAIHGTAYAGDHLCSKGIAGELKEHLGNMYLYISTLVPPCSDESIVNDPIAEAYRRTNAEVAITLLNPSCHDEETCWEWTTFEGATMAQASAIIAEYEEHVRLVECMYMQALLYCSKKGQK